MTAEGVEVLASALVVNEHLEILLINPSSSTVRTSV